MSEVIKESIRPELKSILVRNGDAEVFGSDGPARRAMSQDERVDVFDKAWPDISKEIEVMKEDLSPEDASRLVPVGVRQHFDKTCRHRAISVKGVPFVVQLTRDSDVCNQIWGLGKNNDPSRLSVRFSSVIAHDTFCEHARKLGWGPEALAEEILSGFTVCADAARDPDFDHDTLEQKILMTFGLLLKPRKNQAG